MFLLYNGEYKEIDLQLDYNAQQILDAYEKRKSFVGQHIGDFEIISVEYDWGLRRQVNIAKCVRCGEEKEIPDLRSFERGKGVGRTCPCRYKKKSPKVPLSETYRGYIGQTVGIFKLVDYKETRGFRAECAVCGKQKWVSGKRILTGVETCDHKVVRNYSDPSYMGKRIGSLTVVERVGTLFRFRCDCGTEILQRPTDIFRMDSVKTCGRMECHYHQVTQKAGAIKRQAGIAFEKECAAMMENQGFPVEMLPESGDYGVDFFATVEGERVAFQCKKLKGASVVKAVQEVYAGGRYYDCCKFAVVSPSGFTHSAKKMASKLGVQLEKDLLCFRLKNDLEENLIETRKIQASSGRAIVWEIDGISKPAQQWCDEHGVSRSGVLHRLRRGMDLKAVLTVPKRPGSSKVIIEINGVCKTKQAWCDDYGISPQLYDYRVKYSKLSPLEALSKEKQNLKSQSGKDRAVGETSTWIQLCWDLCG